MAAENQPSGLHISENFSAIYQLETVQIARQTNTLLELYLSNELNDPEFARNYLSSNTAGLLALVETGFVKNLNNLDKLHLLPDSVKKKMLANIPEMPVPQDSTVRTHLENEALNLSIVTFNHIPFYLARYHRKLTGKFSLVSTPRNLEECYGRIKELQEEVQKIAAGETTADTMARRGLPLFRTYLFFRVGQSIPISAAPVIPSINKEWFIANLIANEEKLKTNKILENLLGDLNLDL